MEAIWLKNWDYPDKFDLYPEGRETDPPERRIKGGSKG